MAGKPTRRGWLKGLLGGLFGALFGARAAGGPAGPAPAPAPPPAPPAPLPAWYNCGPACGVTTYTYDAAYRLTASVDLPGACVTTVYDGRGRPVEGGAC
jgi:YD repeat-containing protein